MLFGQFTRGVVPGMREELAQARGPTDLRAASAQPPQSHFRSPAASRINGHVSKHLNMEEVEEDLRPREGDLMKAAPFALPAKNRAERIVPFYRKLRCSD